MTTTNTNGQRLQKDIQIIREYFQTGLLRIQLANQRMGEVAKEHPNFEDLAHGLELFELEALKISERLQEVKTNDDSE